MAPASLVLMTLAVLAALLAHIAIGSVVWASPGAILSEIFRGHVGDTGFNDIVWQIRLPRAIGCVLVGGILGAVGSAFQALFRNPLAEPYVVGVSSGAAAGGTAALVFGFAGALSGLGMVAAAFVGGALAMVLVFAIAGRRGIVDVRTLLLAGVVVSSLLAALLSFMLIISGRDANVILGWLLGNTADLLWKNIAILLVAFLGGSAILILQSKRLNAFAIGETSAQRLGVDVERLKIVILGTGAAMTAAAVGAAGIIGFLGLVAPHIARRLVGVDWRWSLIGAALVGSVLLLISDILAQRIMPGAEIPVGIVTAIIGAPFLLVLMRNA